MAIVLGLAGDTASVGWALIDNTIGQIIATGTWCFDAPEDPEDHTPLNVLRRHYRGQRRAICRRAQRMTKIRSLFNAHGLLQDHSRNALRGDKGYDPWVLRAAALERALSSQELAIALGHIARHRGFRSISKKDYGDDASSDVSGIFKAASCNSKRLDGRTVAQMALTDTDWQSRKRNRNDFTRTVLRSDLEAEVIKIFATQRQLGNTQATEALRNAFILCAFDQRRLQDNNDKVGYCFYEPSEQRTAEHAPSFEMFRLLMHLLKVRLLARSESSKLTPDQILAAVADFGTTKELTFKHLRKRLALDPQTAFDGVQAKDESSRDVASRYGAAVGTHALRQVLGEATWALLGAFPERLDRAAEAITFRDDPVSIARGLAETGLEPRHVAPLSAAVVEGKFAMFRGAAHLSAKAARAINPGLRMSLSVHQALANAGYADMVDPNMDLANIAEPVTRKALNQILRQAREVINQNRQRFGKYGLPDQIHIMLSQELGLGQVKRNKVDTINNRLKRHKEQSRKRLHELLQFEPNVEELLRYDLWQEQGGLCGYSGAAIPLTAIAAGNRSFQVDYILPWSRFCDGSFRNKSLASATAIREKQGRTPNEWFGLVDERWSRFRLWAEACEGMTAGKKIGHYLRHDAAAVEERFRSKNLTDSRYVCRWLLHAFEQWYSKSDREDDSHDLHQQVFVRPSSLTRRLQEAWRLKDGESQADDRRFYDERCHALDAITVAVCSEDFLRHFISSAENAEAAGNGFRFSDSPEPWAGFRTQAEGLVEKVRIARPERRRIRGAAHKATIEQVRERDGDAILYGRKAVDKLTVKDLGLIKDADGRNAPLAALLRTWVFAGKPKDTPPRTSKGDVIRKVRLEVGRRLAVKIRGGSAGRGEMIRVDVFCENRQEKAPRFHLVPIYPHEVVGSSHALPPSRAIVAQKDICDWTDVTAFEFMFSLFQNSLVLVNLKGEFITGYFKGVDTSDAKIRIATVLQEGEVAPTIGKRIPRRVGTKTLASFHKLSIDRLGRVSEVPQEARTWRGQICRSGRIDGGHTRRKPDRG